VKLENKDATRCEKVLVSRFYVSCCCLPWLGRKPLETLPTGAPFVREDAPRIALTHVCVIDGTGAAARADQTLLIEDGENRRDRRCGQPLKFLTARKPWTSPPAQSFPAWLACTITCTIPRPEDRLRFIRNTRQASRACTSPAASLPFAQLAASRSIRTLNSSQPSTREKWAGPRIHVTGPYLEGKGSFTPQMRQLTDAEDARRTVRILDRRRCDLFKAYMNITPDELAAAVKPRMLMDSRSPATSAHRFPRGRCTRYRRSGTRPIVDTEFFPGKKPGQCPDDPSAAEKSLLDLDIAAVPVQDMIRDLVGHHVAITSTLPVFETLVPNRAPLDARVLDAMLPTLASNTWSGAPRSPIHAATSFWPALFKKELEFESEFVKRGGFAHRGTRSHRITAA